MALGWILQGLPVIVSTTIHNPLQCRRYCYANGVYFNESLYLTNVH